MIPAGRYLKETMDLIKIKTNKLINSQECGFLLQEDIWGNDTLLLKSGTYLTEDIITRLLNFGIKKVNVAIERVEDIENINGEEFLEDTQEYSIKSIKNFMNTQSILIVEKNLINASLLLRQLINSGFREGNIFVTKEPSSINGYFRAKQISFLFIENELYETCQKCVEKYSLLRNTHVFILGSVREFSRDKKEGQREGISRIKFLLKPSSSIDEKLNNLVMQALNQNFLDFWNEEEVLIS